jgi:hypothetical protein
MSAAARAEWLDQSNFRLREALAWTVGAGLTPAEPHGDIFERMPHHEVGLAAAGVFEPSELVAHRLKQRERHRVDQDKFSGGLRGAKDQRADVAGLILDRARLVGGAGDRRVADEQQLVD